MVTINYRNIIVCSIRARDSYKYNDITLISSYIIKSARIPGYIDFIKYTININVLFGILIGAMNIRSYIIVAINCCIHTIQKSCNLASQLLHS